MNIILCGPPLAGKSTLGNLAARELNWDFIDTDELIIKSYREMTGKELTCRKIFLEEGEEKFRSLEKKIINSLSNYKTAVIAIGGGALTQAENIKALKGVGTLVYLKTPLPILLERLNSRPQPAYLKKDDPIESFKKTIESRLAIYEAAAQEKIETDSLNEKELVNRICAIARRKHG